jgi:hypothetical protein
MGPRYEGKIEREYPQQIEREDYPIKVKPQGQNIFDISTDLCYHWCSIDRTAFSDLHTFKHRNTPPYHLISDSDRACIQPALIQFELVACLLLPWVILCHFSRYLIATVFLQGCIWRQNSLSLCDRGLRAVENSYLDWTTSKAIIPFRSKISWALV